MNITQLQQLIESEALSTETLPELKAIYERSIENDNLSHEDAERAILLVQLEIDLLEFENEQYDKVLEMITAFKTDLSGKTVDSTTTVADTSQKPVE